MKYQKYSIAGVYVTKQMGGWHYNISTCVYTLSPSHTYTCMRGRVEREGENGGKPEKGARWKMGGAEEREGGNGKDEGSGKVIGDMGKKGDGNGGGRREREGMERGSKGERGRRERVRKGR